MQSKISAGGKIVHAPVKKIVKFDLVCIRIGIGANIVTNF